MKKLLFVCSLFFVVNQAMSQPKLFVTKAGSVSFDAGTGLEDITGVNKATTAAIDPASGKMQFSLLVKGFEFKSQLMQDHFNENYMESDKYPKSTFKGTITNLSSVNFAANGTYPVTVSGKLMIHGVEKDVQTKGTLKVNGTSVTATADFTVVLEDYKIAIPGVVKDKLSKNAKIKVNCTYTLQK